MIQLDHVLTKLKIPFRQVGEESNHHARAGWLQVDCPYCTPDMERWRMGLAETSFAANCYFCGKHPFFESLQKLSGESWRSIRKLTEGLSSRHIDTKSHPGGKLVEPESIGSLLGPHKSFLRDRNLDPSEIMQRWGIGGLGANSKPSWAIYIPISYRGRIVSWTCRHVGSSWRYWSAKPDQEILTHKSILYGEDYCTHTIVVVEGPTDVWKIGPGAVCTFGAKITDAQLWRISQYPKRYICLDREAQGPAKKICDDLSALPGETYRITLDSEDPGSASKKEIKTLRGLL